MSKKLSVKQKLLYGAGSFPANLVFVTGGAWLLYFYVGVEGQGNQLITPLAFSIALGLMRVVDGITDTLVGNWSDNLDTKWGRRTPLIALGTPFLILFFILLWTPPVDSLSMINAVYFFVIYNLVFFTSTLIMVPYQALLPELAATSKERVSLSAAMAYFGILGAIFASFVSGMIIDRWGFIVMGLIVGLLLLTYYLPLLGFREKEITLVKEKQEKTPLFKALAETFSNRPFLHFIGGFVFFKMGFELVLAILPYVVVLMLGQSEGMSGLVTGVCLLAMVATIPLATRLTAAWGKKKVFLCSLGALTAYFPLMYFVGYLPGISSLYQGMVYVFILGIFLSALFVLPNAVLADIVDYDQRRTGRRREAMYYGVQGVLYKASTALSALIISGLFVLFGYSQANPLGVRLAGPVAGMFMLVGLICFLGYPLSEKNADEAEGMPLNESMHG
jgi:glycoside/pentoside/hexuronide:cation symporter, GPH family